MILNTDELIDRIYNRRDKTRIGLTPSKSKSEFETTSGASIDLKLGRWFRALKQSNLPVVELKGDGKEVNFTREYFVSFSGTYVLHPGKFVLGVTLEWINLPGDLVGRVTGKSSLGRRGLVIETAAGVQPGFSGCLTLELANVGEIPIALSPGLEICQLFVHTASSLRDNIPSQFKGSRKPGLGRIQ